MTDSVSMEPVARSIAEKVRHDIGPADFGVPEKYAGEAWNFHRYMLAQQPSAEQKGWQPIETAPKETVYKEGRHSYGPKILAFCAPEVVRVRWWQHEDGSSNFIQDGGRACFPSHWMTLPPPPTLEQFKKESNG